MEIKEMGTIFGLNGHKIEELVYSSRLCAKVDNSLLQDGYFLYHHSFFFSEKGDWVVIQQGINKAKKNVRRYHWGDTHKGFIEEPHDSILCNEKIQKVLNMTSEDCRENKKSCVDIVRENPKKLKKKLLTPVSKGQKRLGDWMNNRKTLVMPRSLNWDAIRAAYEFQPRNYEELVAIKGIGPGTIRGLALLAELIYGNKVSWKDPVKFCFAFGGKDGVPFPIDKKSMDESIALLRTGIMSAKIDEKNRFRSLKRLRKCIPKSNQILLKNVH
jgi:hypothetical protein